MGIQRLKIWGFRSLREVEWVPGRLNVLIGPNASGKSNLLRALALLQKGAQGKLPDEILRMGGIAPLLWDGQVREIGWLLETDPPGWGGGLTKGGMNYELLLQQVGNTSVYLILHELLVSRSSTQSRQDAGQGGRVEQRKIFERSPTYAATFDAEDRSLDAGEGALPGAQTLLSMIGTPFGNPAAFDFCSALAGWTIYHDVRVDPEAPLRQAAVARVERRVAADGQNLVPVLHTLYTGDRDFKKTVDDAMRAAFGDDYEELVFPPAADQRVQMRVRWRSLRTEQPAADLSDGTVRFLLLVAMLSTPSPGDLIAIDEPETGLHPSMLPIIAELARAASERTQVILTTHSPQFLDAFGREPPTVTVTGRADGRTTLSVVDDQELRPR